MHAKDHEGLLNAVVDCFTTSPDAEHVPTEGMLSRNDLAMQLVPIAADGASGDCSLSLGVSADCCTRAPCRFLPRWGPLRH